MNNSKQLVPIARILLRNFSKSAAARASDPIAPKFNKLREAQKQFQIDDGTPVYLKGGFSDKFLYQLSLALTALGLGLSGHTLYAVTFGKTS